MKKIFHLFLMSVLLLSSLLLPPPNKVMAAQTEHYEGDLTFDPSSVLFDGKPSPNEVISRSKTLSWSDITINQTDPIVRVELRKEPYGASDVVKPLTRITGNQYEIGSIDGTPIEAKRKEVPIPLGYYAWFRDPTNKFVWMYDYNNKRYYHNTSKPTPPTVYDRPPSGECLKADGPYPYQVTSEVIPECDVAWENRHGTLWTNTMTITKTDDEVNISDVDDLTFDKDFEFKVTGSLDRGNIIEIANVHIDPNTLNYSFDFKAKYNTEPDKADPDKGNGPVLYWNNQWSMNLIGKVYTYQKLKVYAITDSSNTGCTPGDPTCTPSGGGSCPHTVGQPTEGPTRPASVIDPSVSGVNRADNRGAEKFNVLQGIPTSESLYTNVFAYNYLYKQNWVPKSGKTTYKCSVTLNYILHTQVCSKAGCTDIYNSASRTYNFDVYRDYSYWEIKALEVHKINNATMSNYALPSGTVTMYPSGYTPPSLQYQNDTDVLKHVHPASAPTISYTPPQVEGTSPPDDTSRLKGMAESGIADSKVNNDTVKFSPNGGSLSTIMDGAQYPKNGPTPGDIPAPTMIGQDVLYKPNNVISNSLANNPNTPTTGTIYYEMLTPSVGGATLPGFTINGINTVTVHTPVVNYSDIPDINRPFDQSMNPDYSKTVLVLGRPFR
ncbi:DUF5704 domain-containing protein, partial [Paenibacillus marchantiophytorum]|uniref:DUF5704 domain-containing protein n=1 Tax=Paenibacillus marchantiophytorum TaxID=1619310 RepID=UPI001E565723